MRRDKDIRGKLACFLPVLPQALPGFPLEHLEQYPVLKKFLLPAEFLPGLPHLAVHHP